MAISPIGLNLHFTGQINPSLTRSFSYASMGLKKLQNQAVMTTRAIGAIGRGFLSMAAFGGGFAALAGITTFMSEAVKLGKQQQNVTLSLNTLLTANLRLRHQNVALAKDELATIEKQSKALQEHSGIFNQIYTKGASILATAHLTSKQIMQLQPAMGNLMAYRRTMGDNPEQLTKTSYEAITKAIFSGQARGLNQEGVQVSPMDKMIMIANAKTGHIQENIQIVLRYLSVFKGEMVKYQKSMAGQVDLATAHIQEKMSLVGKAFLPVQQQVTLLADKFVTLISPSLMLGFKYITIWLRDLNTYMQANMPLFKQWIKEGWIKAANTATWFQQNSNWLIPFLTDAVKWFGAWVLVMGTFTVATRIATAAMILFDLTNPVGWISLAVIGITELIWHWKELAKLTHMNGFMEALVGTKAYNPDAEGLTGARRGHRPGEVPRAQPVQLGVVEWFKQFNGRRFDAMVEIWLNEMKTKVVNWLSGIGQSWDAAVLGWVASAKVIFDKWMENLKEGFQKRMNSFWNPMQEGIIGVGKTIGIWLLSPVRALNEQWQKFLNFIGMGGAGSNATDSYQGGGGSGEKGTSGTWSNSPHTWNPMRAPLASGANHLAYSGEMYHGHKVWTSGGTFSGGYNDHHVRMYRGRVLPDPGPDATGAYKTYEEYLDEDPSSRYGPSYNRLSESAGVALGPAVARHWGAQQGDWVNVEGLGWRQLNESSNANNGIEVVMPRKRQGTLPERLHILGVRRVNRNSKTGGAVDQPLPDHDDGGASSGDTHVHNNVVYNIHGDDDHRHIATLHHKHVELITKSIADANYRRGRGQFA